MIPDELRYTAEHEWVRGNDPSVTVGITHFAQDSLGDIVYVSLPAVGSQVTAGEPCGEVESTKSVSDIYAPLTGEVSAVNGDLSDAPEKVNSDPYGDGWMFVLRIEDATQLDTLLTAADYRAITEKA